jgi:hypothetical protein
MFELIKDDLKQKDETELTKESIWQYCYGINESYSDLRFRKLQSDLLRLIEDFYAQETFEANPLHKSKYLLETVHKKNLLKIQSGALKSAQKLAETQHLKPASFYYYQYEIEQSIYKLNQDEFERKTKSNIEAIAQNLDRFYLAEKLRYYCTILSHQLNAALDYEILFMDEIIEHVKTNDYSDVPPILIYFQILLTYKEPENEQHYAVLKELIDMHIRESFNLYTKYLSNGILLVSGKLTPWSFKNMVTIGLRLQEFNWVEDFIQTKSQLIDPHSRENAVAFNLAQLYFYKKDYSKVITHLSHVEYDDPIYDLNSKIFLMASYYELDEIEALNSLLDTFRVYLTRKNTIPKEKAKRYINTIHIVRKLARIKQGDQKAIEKLTKEIESIEGITSKNWILEKLAALKA